MFRLEDCIRANIKRMEPYSSARHEDNSNYEIHLDANENSNESRFNRYPDPFQKELKETISEIKGIDIENIFVGNGSDEAIDLIVRAFCCPTKDCVYIFPPTYGMYKVIANINNVAIEELNLTTDMELPSMEVLKNRITRGGVLFICNPNNPTGNIFSLKKIREIANLFNGIVIVDEAYIDFSNAKSAIGLLGECRNVVVIQTMSKAYGMAGIRIGMAYASNEIVAVLNKIKPPYNINSISQQYAVNKLLDKQNNSKEIKEIVDQREVLISSLQDLEIVKKVYPTQANFILVEFDNVKAVFRHLKRSGILVRDKSHEVENTLRITVGLSDQNRALVNCLKKISE